MFAILISSECFRKHVRFILSMVLLYCYWMVFK